MRPVRLDLDGFASFRRAASIDLRDVDYFALVGPTGSGKSTLIDGIVFALYGTAPRWGRSNAIEYALAPTANRGTVRMLFDVGEHRYVVAREVRRTGKGIAQRTTSLERLHDPDDEQAGSTVLASDPRAIRDEVERIVGLSYDDFTQCVVLPQGHFANFLKASGKDRQQILIKLLGADRYEKIRKAASLRAQKAQNLSQVLAAQLESYQDATAGAVERAREQVRALTVARRDAEQVGQELTAARQAAAEARAGADTARGQLALLEAIEVPDGLAEAQQRAGTARAAARAAEEAADAAARAHSRARAALDAAGDRQQLSTREGDWTVLAERQAAQPGLVQDAEDAAGAHRRAGQALAEAEDALEQAATAERAADEAAARARRLADDLQARWAALTAVTVPDEVEGLAGRWREARDARDAAAQAVTAAEEAEQQADAAAAAGPDPGTLERALTLTGALADRREALRAATAAAEDAADEEGAAQARLQEAQTAAGDAGGALDRALTRDRAAAIRADLSDGDTCPVCGGTVHDPPDGAAGSHPGASGTAGAGEVSQARRAHRAAEKALSAAREQHGRARNAHLRARVTAEQAAEAVRQGESELAALPLPEEVFPPARTSGARDAAASAPDRAALEQSLTQARALGEAVPRARAVTREARAALAAADDALSAATAAGTRARDDLTRAAATVIPLGYQPSSRQDLAQDWQQVAEWAAGRAEQTGLERDAAAEQVTVAEAAAGQAADTLARARQDVAAARERATAAEVAATRATHRRDEAAARISALTALLTGQPDHDATRAALTRFDEVAEAERQAYARTQQAATALADARRVAQQAEEALVDSRTRLRDQAHAVHGLGAPTLDLDDLPAAWATLTAWAAEQATALRTRTLPDLVAAAAEADAAGQRAETELATRIAHAGLPPVTPLEPAAVQSAFADAAASAKAEQAGLQGRVTVRQRLSGQLATAEEEAAVADTLAKLLQVNNFQRWLAGAALETLVTGASQALLELSGGQFDLTHENGEFYVIDHADADSQRSVRTLSGGETFQASLALALTLSEQLSGLTTTGRARLDSIFLDEGFGTLDSDSLDTVAATLERLTQSERMVGIVTHVGALADRVPVRFAVSRDAQGSRVARVDA